MSTIFNHTLTSQNETIFIPFEYNPLLSTIEVLSTSPINYTYDNVSKTITITDTLTIPLDITIRRKTIAPTETFDRGNLSSTKLNDVFKRQQLALVELQDGGSVYINKDLNMNGFNIVNMADGVNDKDAVNKSQLDVTLSDVQSLESSYTTLQTEYNDLLGRVVDLENNSGGGSNTPSIINLKAPYEVIYFNECKSSSTTYYHAASDGIGRLLFDGQTFFKVQPNTKFDNPVDFQYTVDSFGATLLNITNTKCIKNMSTNAMVPITIGFHMPLAPFNNGSFNSLECSFRFSATLGLNSINPLKVTGYILESDVNDSFDGFASNIKKTKIFENTGQSTLNFTYNNKSYVLRKSQNSLPDGQFYFIDFNFNNFYNSDVIDDYIWNVTDDGINRATGVFIPRKTLVFMVELPAYPANNNGNDSLSINYELKNGGDYSLFSDILPQNMIYNGFHNIHINSSDALDQFRFYHPSATNIGLSSFIGKYIYSYQLFEKANAFNVPFVKKINTGTNYPINDNYKLTSNYFTNINIVPLLYMYKYGNTQNFILPSAHYNTGSGSSSLSFPVIYNDGIDDYRTIQLNMPNMSNVYDTVAFSKDGDLL